MNWGVYAILIIFGLFILLMMINPRLSCFGRRIKSPLYPLFRKETRKRRTEEYGFRLGNKSYRRVDKNKEIKKEKKTEDYGFHLD